MYIADILFTPQTSNTSKSAREQYGLSAQDPSCLPHSPKYSILAVSTLYSVKEQSFYEIPPSAEVCTVHVIKVQSSDCIILMQRLRPLKYFHNTTVLHISVVRPTADLSVGNSNCYQRCYAEGCDEAVLSA